MVIIIIIISSVNQSGTLRTLKGLTGDPNRTALVPYSSSSSRTPGRSSRSIEDLHPVSHQIGSGRPGLGSGIPVLRSRADVFQVGPSGGHFRSSSNRGVNIFFPRNSVESIVSITMQVIKLIG